MECRQKRGELIELAASFFVKQKRLSIFVGRGVSRDINLEKSVRVQPLKCRFCSSQANPAAEPAASSVASRRNYLRSRNRLPHMPLRVVRNVYQQSANRRRQLFHADNPGIL